MSEPSEEDVVRLLREELETAYVDISNLRTHRLALEAQLDWYRMHLARYLHVPKYEEVADPRAALRDYARSADFQESMRDILQPLLRVAVTAAVPATAAAKPGGFAGVRAELNAPPRPAVDPDDFFRFAQQRPKIPDASDERAGSGIQTVLTGGTGTLRCEELDITWDYAAVQASRHGVALKLTNTEACILVLLLQNPRRVLTRTEVLRVLWGNDALDLDTRAVDAQIYRLRRKLGGSGELIRGVPGLGYSLL